MPCAGLVIVIVGDAIIDRVIAVAIVTPSFWPTVTLSWSRVRPWEHSYLPGIGGQGMNVLIFVDLSVRATVHDGAGGTRARAPSMRESGYRLRFEVRVAAKKSAWIPWTLS